ncbi:MAG: hypothetical protein HRT88_06440 [Lentisphaeraceae bacterium]|nr:hypothetical protein [Lentisphaeraceae bacterium]
MFKHIAIVCFLLLEFKGTAQTESLNKSTPGQKTSLSAMPKEVNPTAIDMHTLKKSSDDTISIKMAKLLNERDSIIDKLLDTDKSLKIISQKSNIWDNEIRVKTKGRLDTLIDEADRLHTSNHFRTQIIIQYKNISDLIAKLVKNRENIARQKVLDDEKAELKRVKAERQKVLMELKEAQRLLIAFQSDKQTDDSQLKKQLVRILTLEQDMTIGNIAYEQYQDYDKWLLIYEHRDNKDRIPSKSEKAVIPKGTILIIPNFDTEE